MHRRFLVIGHEAREHAIAWKLARSPQVEAVHVHTGNVAMASEKKFSFVNEQSFEELAAYALENRIDCTVVGNTAAMQGGVVDIFRKHGLAILGATQAAAQLEGSKLFGKEFLLRHGIPTARHRVCTNPLGAREFLQDCSYPVVLKADTQVSRDKSAVIVHDEEQARAAYLDIFFAQRKGAQIPPVLFEEFITGREISYMILMDGTDWVPLAAVRDYKRLQDADAGPNTGGMGSYAPVPWLTAELEETIRKKVVLPTLRGMQAEGLQYRGFLYFGLMIDAHGVPWVLEYNTRLGDTEGETMLMLLDEDFADLALRAATASLKDARLKWRAGCAISVALAPEGYPAKPVKSPVSLPLPTGEDVTCFGALIDMSSEHGIHSGNGRVGCITGFAENASQCREKVYAMARQFDKEALFQYRTDIALELAGEA